jgi:hypothetical protein
MTKACLVLLAIIQPLASTDAASQERRSKTGAMIDRTGDFLIALFERPLRPDFATVAPGSGIGAGLTLNPRCPGSWCVDAGAVATVRRYWGAQGRLDFTARTTHVAAYSEIRDMPKLDFFGVGSASAESDRTVFGMKDRLFGILAEQRLVAWLTVSARAELLSPEVGAGHSSDLASIETRFDDADAPGLTRQPDFARYQAGLLLDIPSPNTQALNQGGALSAAYSLYADRDLESYSFRRLDIEARQSFRLPGELRRLTLHGRYSTTEATSGNTVPFYLMPTLGGFQLAHGSWEQAIGSDGTLATLRGFTNYRFRDRHALLLQAEYRMPVWGPIDLSVFADAGKVAGRRAELDLSHLRRDFGVGLSLMRGAATAARFDAAFGGGEGSRVFLTIGRVVAP